MKNFWLINNIILKDVFFRKTNLFVFLVALYLFSHFMSLHIEKNLFIRNWVGIIISNDMTCVIQEYSRKLTLDLTVYLIIACLLNNLTPFFINDNFINSRQKIFNIGCSNFCLLLSYISSSLILYNILMLPYWIFMFYFSYGSIYFNYVFGIIFFYNMFIIKALLVIMIFILKVNFINLKEISTFSLILLLLFSYFIVLQFLGYLANLYFYLGSFGLIYQKLYAIPTFDFYDVTGFMSPVIHFPYKPMGQMRYYYTIIHFIKYIFIVFIPMVIICGYYSLKSFETHKKMILNSKYSNLN